MTRDHASVGNPEADRWTRIWDGAGVFALLYFALFAFHDVARANQGLLLMALIAVLRYPRELWALRGERMLQLTLLFLVYLVVRAWLATRAFPEQAAQIVDAANNWAITGFLGLVVTAFWLTRTRVRVEWLLGLALAGFIGRILTRLDWSRIGAQLQGFVEGPTRATFGYSAVNLGIWSAIALLGLLVCWRSFLRRRRQPAARVATAALWLACIGVCGAALVFSQARSAWITALLVLPLFALFTLHRATRSPRHFVAGALVLVIGGAFALAQVAELDLIEQRVAYERQTIEQVLSGDFDALPADSVGLRLAMYRAFWDDWRERPWFGWGPGLMERALDRAGVNAMTEERFTHFHSSYFDVLFQFGIVGALLVGGMFWLIVQRTLQSRASGQLSPEVTQCILGGLLIFLIAALVNEPLQSSNGGYLVVLFGAIAHRAHYRSLLARPAVD